MKSDTVRIRPLSRDEVAEFMARCIAADAREAEAREISRQLAIQLELPNQPVAEQVNDR